MVGFVVLEGIDGCGKSSVARSAAERFGKRTVLTREPTDSWIGKAVRKGDKKEVSPYTDALLFMADRAQHTLEIADMLKKGKLVVCDRYYHSTIAYQTASLRRTGLGDNFDWLLDANTRISIRPDITFIIEVDPEISLDRIRNRSELSRFEKLDFLKEVKRNYRRLAKIDDSIIRVDGDRTLEEVTEEVIGTIKERRL
jgi:dTMP kinase